MHNIPFTSKLQHITNLTLRNKAFAALSNRQKRQEIAYDALLLVIAGTIGAAEGHYWSYNLKIIKNSCDTSEVFQRKLVYFLPKTCTVCQRGALMLSQIRLGNTIHPLDICYEYGNRENIEGFNIKMFRSLEQEYEQNYKQTPYQRRTIQKLANLLCNIIDCGNFNAPRCKDYLTLWNIALKPGTI